MADRPAAATSPIWLATEQPDICNAPITTANALTLPGSRQRGSQVLPNILAQVLRQRLVEVYKKLLREVTVIHRDKPTTLAECFTFLRGMLTPAELEDLKGLNHEDLWQAHMSLGPRVRELVLKDNPGLEQRLENTALCGEPDLAVHIITAFWDDLGTG